MKIVAAYPILGFWGNTTYLVYPYTIRHLTLPYHFPFPHSSPFSKSSYKPLSYVAILKFGEPVALKLIYTEYPYVAIPKYGEPVALKLIYTEYP